MCNISRVNHYVLQLSVELSLYSYETDLYVLKRVKGSARELMELICLNLS